MKTGSRFTMAPLSDLLTSVLPRRGVLHRFVEDPVTVLGGALCGSARVKAAATVPGQVRC